MQIKNGLFFLVTILVCRTNYAFNILVFLPISLQSHIVPFQSLLYSLADRGHNVTEVSAFQPKKNHPNYHFRQIPQSIPDNKNRMQVMRKFMQYQGPQLVQLFSDFCLLRMEEALNLTEVRDFVENDNSEFDVIIAEITFCGEIFLPLGHKYGAPIINFQPLGYSASKFYHFGNLLSPVSIPDFRLRMTDRMSFFETLENIYVTLLDLYNEFHYYHPRVEQLMKRVTYTGVHSKPDLYTMLNNISMTFVEYDPNIGIPYPVAPNIIFTGGLHLKPSKKLPNELQQFMNDAPHGVIYFSLGSNLQFSYLPESVKKAFIDSFKRLKYKIIWKSDIELTVSSNVLVGKWFPQSDILGHKNCKLFITHGGIHSAMESGYYGVPLVMVPGFSDQFQNVLIMKNLGMGVVIELNTLTAEIIVDSVEEVVNNQSYTENVKHISKHMKTAPLSNLEKAIYWTEYVAANKGAPHLKPNARNQSLLRLLGIDIVLYLGVGLIFCVVLLVLLCKVLYAAYCYSPHNTKSKKQKQN